MRLVASPSGCVAHVLSRPGAANSWQPRCAHPADHPQAAPPRALDADTSKATHASWPCADDAVSSEFAQLLVERGDTGGAAPRGPTHLMPPTTVCAIACLSRGEVSSVAQSRSGLCEAAVSKSTAEENIFARESDSHGCTAFVKHPCMRRQVARPLSATGSDCVLVQVVAAQLDALQRNDWPDTDAGVRAAFEFSKPHDAEQLLPGEARR